MVLSPNSLTCHSPISRQIRDAFSQVQWTQIGTRRSCRPALLLLRKLIRPHKTAVIAAHFDEVATRPAIHLVTGFTDIGVSPSKIVGGSVVDRHRMLWRTQHSTIRGPRPSVGVKFGLRQSPVDFHGCGSVRVFHGFDPSTAARMAAMTWATGMAVFWVPSAGTTRSVRWPSAVTVLTVCVTGLAGRAEARARPRSSSK